MKKFSKQQAQAITGMARGTSDYNRGVLAMLGQSELALAHNALKTTLEIQHAERDALIPADHGFSIHFPMQLKPCRSSLTKRAGWKKKRGRSFRR